MAERPLETRNAGDGVLTRRRLGPGAAPECALSTEPATCRQLATAVDDPPDPPAPPEPDPDEDDDPDEPESDDPDEDGSDFDPDEVVAVVEVDEPVSLAVEEDRLSVR